MTWHYEKNFGKLKSAVEHQKSHERFSEYICHSCSQNSKHCLLCLNEKYEIATDKGDTLLNKRTDKHFQTQK